MNPDTSPSRVKNLPQTCKALKTSSFKSSSKFSPSKKMSPAATQKNCYEKSCCGHVSRSHYNSFLVDLHSEIKKIDGSIPVSFDEKTVLSSVLSSVKQAVDYILLVQSKFSHTDWADLENFKSNLKLQEAKLKNESEKLKITARHLEQYDSMLKSKEEQMKNEEKKCVAKMDLLKQEDLFNEELKLKNIQLEQEVRLLKKQKVSAKDVLEGAYITEIESLKKENLKLKEILYNKNNLEALDSQRTLDQLMLNKEKYKLEHVKLELEQMKLTIENEKKKINLEGRYSTDTKENLENNEVSTARLHVKPIKNRKESSDWKDLDSEAQSNNSEIEKSSLMKSQELDYRECLLIQSEKELSRSVFQIKEQIEAYNQELEIKEKNLEDQAASLLAREKNLNDKIIDLKLAEESLNVSKAEIDEISSSVLPSFEAYSQAVSQLLADLYLKKQELSEMLEKVYKLQENIEIQESVLQEEQNLLSENFQKEMEKVKEREERVLEREEKIRVVEDLVRNKEEQLGNEINENIMKVSLELQEKLKSVQDKEMEIERIKEALDVERAGNEKIAVRLKMTHLEMENNRIKQMEKFRIKKEKLRELKEKLEGKSGNKLEE
jgi:hypothetical protein